jgi:hypothetical protein
MVYYPGKEEFTEKINKINGVNILLIVIISLLSISGLFYIVSLFDKPVETHTYLLYNKVGNSDCGDLNTDYYYQRTERGIDGRDIAYTNKAEYFCYGQFKEIKNWENEDK